MIRRRDDDSFHFLFVLSQSLLVLSMGLVIDWLWHKSMFWPHTQKMPNTQQLKCIFNEEKRLKQKFHVQTTRSRRIATLSAASFVVHWIMKSSFWSSRASIDMISAVVTLAAIVGVSTGMTQVAVVECTMVALDGVVSQQSRNRYTWCRWRDCR